ncbi:MAG TPA: TetR/AcrR family transcriptional regulator [Streptosporangiaceae bacterium]|nr:TetR/AcrR family transcriptional regulator [Streptosporangiaceae bacterium]
MISAPTRATRRYRSSLREAQARRTRRRVMEAAAAVFLERGYGGTTIRAIAAAAEVSVPTVEALFGTKARLLKAAIDVAIAGDDEPVAVLDRPWAKAAREAQSVEKLVSVVAGVLGAAQRRSAGLVLAVFEGSSGDAELRQLAAQMAAQRAVTAAWIVESVTRVAPLRQGSSVEEAVDTVWLLMDPAVFDRLTRQRQWAVERYERWVAAAIARLLVPDAAQTPGGPRADRPRRARPDRERRRSAPSARSTAGSWGAW